MQFIYPVVWSAEKNEELKHNRGICFEDVYTAIEKGDVLDTELHPNQRRYPGQQRLIIRIIDYAYIVPLVIDHEQKHVFLKTIIPSRKHTKKYLSK